MSGARGAWGWHPLKDSWAKRLVAEAPIRTGDLVMDLGAGTGALTLPLIDAGANVIAVELHAGRLQTLRERAAGRAKVVQADLSSLYLPGRCFHVVANPPFALTTHLVRTLLRSDALASANLVVQLGAARGLTSRPPSSITKNRSAQRYRLSIGRHLPASAFTKAPPVRCAVLRIERR